jgi:hypothetical protein
MRVISVVETKRIFRMKTYVMSLPSAIRLREMLKIEWRRIISPRVLNITRRDHVRSVHNRHESSSLHNVRTGTSRKVSWKSWQLEIAIARHWHGNQLDVGKSKYPRQ